MLRNTLSALALLAAAACGGPEFAYVPPAPEPVSPVAAPAAPAFSACSAVLTPADPTMAELLGPQVAAWNAATGCAVSIGPGGTPVSLVDSLADPDTGNPVWGNTDYVTAKGDPDAVLAVHSVQISRVSTNPAQTLRHELGHFMGIHTHTADGLMAAHYTGTMAIDATALELACQSTACLAFQPE